MSRYGWLIVVAVFAMLLAGLVPGERSVHADESYEREELKLLDLLNGYREENGVAPLVLSDALTKAAERHSEDMGRYGFFDHGSVKSSYFPAGSRSWERMALSGYDHEDASRSENLAAGIGTAEKSLEAWRASPAHNRAMLDGDKQVVGIARVRVPGSEHGWYWTTDFGSKKDPTSHASDEAGKKPASERKKPEKKRASDKRWALATAGKAQDDRKADGEGVENGSLDGEGAWEQKTNENGKKLVENGVARLGGDDARDELFQKIRAREGQRLTYRIKVETEEKDHPADGLVVRLTDEKGKHLATIESHTNADAEESDGWRKDGVDLSRFAGRTVYLGFLAKTDEERPTTFYVDDVVLE